MCWDAVVDLYERHAHDFDQDRGRSLWEKSWLDTCLARTTPSGVVLDIGCGMAEPVARYMIHAGFRVVGVDSSPSMVAMCHARFPEHEWIVADMRQLNLGRRFDALVAWDSFFHLRPEDQRGMFQRFAAHARPGAPLMFTSGTGHGETVGAYHGEPLYHGSLDTAEYERLLNAHGFRVLDHRVEDEECAGHTVWLAEYEGTASAESARLGSLESNQP
jgi:trans-aconitate methyltransferase